ARHDRQPRASDRASARGCGSRSRSGYGASRWSARRTRPQCTFRRVQGCPACGGPLTPWRSVPSSEPALGDVRFELLRCERCGSAVTAGAGAPELHDTGAYGAPEPRLAALAAPALRVFDRPRLAMLRTLVAPP